MWSNQKVVELMERRSSEEDWGVGYLYEDGNARRPGNHALGMGPTNERSGSRTCSDLPATPELEHQLAVGRF